MYTDEAFKDPPDCHKENVEEPVALGLYSAAGRGARSQEELVPAPQAHVHYLSRRQGLGSGSGKLRCWWVAFKLQWGIATSEGQFRNKKTASRQLK